MVEIKMEEQDALEDESYIEQVSDSDWGTFQLVFNKENLPEEVKSKYVKDELQKYLREELTQKGIKVKRVRKGLYNDKEVLFVRIDQSIRPTLAQFLKTLNEEYWGCFDSSYFEASTDGDFWGESNGSRVTGTGRCLVFIIRKMPEEIKAQFESENLEQHVEKILKDNKVTVVKMNKMDKASTHILYVNINHKNDKTFPKLVEDLNVVLWDCLANPKRIPPVQCSLCKIVLGASEKVDIQSHLKGKSHQKMLKKKDDIGIVFSCELCDIKTFCDREGYEKHLNGAKHLKNTNIIHGKECEVCKYTATDENDLKTHMETEEHKKEVGFPDSRSFGIKINCKLWRCELCDVSSHTEDAIKGHLNGSRHKKLADNLEKTGTVPRPAETITCKLCNISTGSEATFNKHLEGSKHKKKLAQDGNNLTADVEMRVQEGEAVVKTEANQMEITCELCCITVKSQITFNLHLEGAKHKKNKAKKEGLPDAEAVSKERVERKCDLCNVTSVSEIGFKAHMEGAKHRKKLKQIEPNTNVVKMEEDKSDEKPKKSQPQGGEGKFTCSLCGIQTNDDSTMQKHLLGNKHKKKLEVMEKAGESLVKTENEATVQVKPDTTTIDKAKGKVFCDLCCIVTNDDSAMQIHISGAKHRKKLKLTANSGDESRKRKMEEGFGDGNVGTEKKFCQYDNPIPVLGCGLASYQ